MTTQFNIGDQVTLKRQGTQYLGDGAAFTGVGQVTEVWMPVSGDQPLYDVWFEHEGKRMSLRLQGHHLVPKAPDDQ